MKVPGFLVRQFYVSGSLRNTESGFTLQARNALGNGQLVGVARLTVDGTEIPASAVTAVRESDGRTFRASDVTDARPIDVRQGDRVTLNVAAPPLAPGKHELQVELAEASLGIVRLTVTDTVR